MPTIHEFYKRPVCQISFLLLTLVCFSHLKAADREAMACNMARVQSGVELTLTERANFTKNMSLMGMDQFNATRIAGDIYNWESFLFYGVKVKAPHSEKATELFLILTSPHNSLTTLKKRLDSWAKKHKIQIEFVFRDYIIDYGKRSVKKEVLDLYSGVIQNNGFIAPPVYTRLITEGKLPIVDPHDILMHALSFANQTFAETFDKYAKLATELGHRLGDPVNLVMEPFVAPREMSIRSNTNLLDFLKYTVRDMAIENWTYLVKGKSGEPLFFMQGNVPFNGYLDLRRRNAQSFVGRLLNFRGGQRQTTNPVEDSFSHLLSLTGLSKFLDEHPERFALLDKIGELYSKSSLTKKSYKNLSEKILKFIERENLIKQGNPTEDMKPAEVEYVFYRLASFVSGDPELKFAFDKTTRELLFSNTMTFVHAYKEWMDKTYGLPPAVQTR